MERKKFAKIAEEEFPRAVPDKFREKIKNVAILVEDAPSDAVRRDEGLAPDETLLGYYHGIPLIERGDSYGFGITLPDTITLYQEPIEEMAGDNEAALRRIIRETLWHEVAHYFGLDDPEVEELERKRGHGSLD